MYNYKVGNKYFTDSLKALSYSIETGLKVYAIGGEVVFDPESLKEMFTEPQGEEV